MCKNVSGVGDFPSTKRSSALVSLLRAALRYPKTESGIPQGRHASLRDHSHSLTPGKHPSFKASRGRNKEMNGFCRIECVRLFGGGMATHSQLQ